MLYVGYNGRVSRNKVVAIVPFDTNPAVRRVQTAREEGKLIDCTRGRKTRTVIFLESGQIVLSTATPEKLAERWDEEIRGNEIGRGEGTT